MRFPSLLTVTFLLISAEICTLAADPPSTTNIESLWIEAEHLQGVQGYCWPMGKPTMRETKGHWGLSGPGWAAEWNQGGESGFLSIACGAGDATAAATTALSIPADGSYHVWVRAADWREASDRFDMEITQAGQPQWKATYGTRSTIEEDNVMKLYFGWAFGWESHTAPLKRGPATLTFRSTVSEPNCRQIDCLVLTTDANYRPRIKERPRNFAWEVSDSYRRDGLDGLEPLARAANGKVNVPAAWQPRTFQDRGFLYLWNIAKSGELDWAGDDPRRVLYPWNVGDTVGKKEFKARYGGQKEVPIFSDPRIVPTFHEPGLPAAIFATDAPQPATKDAAAKIVGWLEKNPNRLWATLMNYHPDTVMTPAAHENWEKLRNRFVGSISGENLGYFPYDAKALEQAAAQAGTRRGRADVLSKFMRDGNAAKYEKVYGKPLSDPYAHVIACKSTGGIWSHALCFDWGAKIVGYESAVIPGSLLSMRMAFLRGAARQFDGMTATYRSCNFGDSATIFSNDVQLYAKPVNILDNYYSVYSGAGMTWYKMDIWQQYMAGAALFYHEQGHDEFWIHGGTTAAGVRPLELSPKGKLVDRFLRVTAANADRGAPYTPVAFLVDYAHGWEPSPYVPHQFAGMTGSTEQTHYGRHEQALHQWFWTAFHPVGPHSQEPITSVNETYVPGTYGDLFDVIYAFPDIKKWRTIDQYPVVIVAGDIEMTAAEGDRLRQYMEQGGTLLVSADQLTGPGAAKVLDVELAPSKEARSYGWLSDTNSQPAQQFAYRAIVGGRPLATTPAGESFCAAFDRGAGRLIVLSVPYGLGIDQSAHPVVPRLLAHLTRGLMPIDVQGDVQWSLNAARDGRWLLTLLNPAGQRSPQQGILPTDFRENRDVTIRSRLPISTARDWLLESDKLAVKDNQLQLVVPAGGVRIIEVK